MLNAPACQIGWGAYTATGPLIYTITSTETVTGGLIISANTPWQVTVRQRAALLLRTIDDAIDEAAEIRRWNKIAYRAFVRECMRTVDVLARPRSALAPTPVPRRRRPPRGEHLGLKNYARR